MKGVIVINKPDIATVQTAHKDMPYCRLSAYYPKQIYSYPLFHDLKEAVPVIGAAIGKLTRLLGEFEIETADKHINIAINDMLKSIPVGTGQYGADAFLSTYFSQLLTYGTAVGEIVTDGEKIVNLYNANLKDIALTKGKNPLEVVISTRNERGEFYPVKNPNLVLVSVHDPEPGAVYGTSVLEGLPFVADILLKIYSAIGTNWERLGNVRYCVTYKPQNEGTDKAFAQSRAKMIADEWSKTINSNGSVKDFIAVGDVEIKAIGADNIMPGSEIPVRQMLEQIVAKLGVPPFLLGLSWSSTERMSSQQADILTSEIEAYRRELNPVIRKICTFWLRLNGYNTDFEIKWNDITLQDISELAKSEYYLAQAKNLNSISD